MILLGPSVHVQLLPNKALSLEAARKMVAAVQAEAERNQWRGVITLNSGTGFGKGSRRRFLHELIENSSGAYGNHCSHKTRNDENAHDLSPASQRNLQHLP
jgi:hypothetical protein